MSSILMNIEQWIWSKMKNTFKNSWILNITFEYGKRWKIPSKMVEFRILRTNMVKDEWRECPRSNSCQSRPQRTDKSAWPSRESEVTSSTFISYSKLLLQIFQTNMRCHITIWWWWCRTGIRQMFYTSVMSAICTIHLKKCIVRKIGRAG